LPKPLFSHRAYQAVIAIKGLDGAIEVLAGAIVAIAGVRRLSSYIELVMAPELAAHFSDHAARAVRHGATGLEHASAAFIVFYLLVHGILKLGIAVNLLREKRQWVFPVATAILTGFILFMGYRLTMHWSGWLFGFALFDCLTVALVLNEWRKA
jgi:uncharacterized membrane protein